MQVLFKCSSIKVSKDPSIQVVSSMFELYEMCLGLRYEGRVPRYLTALPLVVLGEMLSYRQKLLADYNLDRITRVE